MEICSITNRRTVEIIRKYSENMVREGFVIEVKCHKHCHAIG